MTSPSKSGVDQGNGQLVLSDQDHNLVDERFLDRARHLQPLGKQLAQGLQVDTILFRSLLGLRRSLSPPDAWKGSACTAELRPRTR